MQIDQNERAKLFFYNLKRLPEQYIVEDEVKK